MKARKIATLVAAAALTLTASSAFAAFTDLSLERFVYNSTTEVATDLGNVNDLMSKTNYTIGSGASSFTTLLGTSDTPLYVAYFAYDNNTGNLWLSAEKGLGSITGSLNGSNSAASVANNINGYYTVNTTVAATTVTSDSATSAVSVRTGDGVHTFFQKMDQNFVDNGAFQQTIDLGYYHDGVVEMDLTQSVTQGLYYFNLFDFIDSWDGESDIITLTEVGTVTTNADGTTTINATNSTPTPIPAAFYLMGSGLLGLVGLRRRNEK